MIYFNDEKIEVHVKQLLNELYLYLMKDQYLNKTQKENIERQLQEIANTCANAR